MLPSKSFPIGLFSRQAGVKIETIRYYERMGLLAKPPRTSGGYRLYRPDDIERLAFIRRARDLGFSLQEIARLLGLADGKSRSCRRVRDLAAEHLSDVQRKLADLHRMEAVLSDLIEACADGALPACPLLRALGREETGEATPP